MVFPDVHTTKPKIPWTTVRGLFQSLLMYDPIKRLLNIEKQMFLLARLSSVRSYTLHAEFCN